MLVLFYMLFGIEIIIYELLRKKRFWFDYLTVFNIYFIAYYVFPAIMINSAFGGYIPRMSSNYSNANIEGTTTAAIVMLISYLSIIFGYKYVLKKNMMINTNFDKLRYYISNEPELFKKMFVFLVIIGIISFIVYASLFGGFLQLLFYTNQIRNSAIQSEDASLEFIRRFIPALMYASYLIYAKYLINGSKKLLIITLLLSSPWFIVNGGRGAILTYLLILFFSYMLQKKKTIPIVKGVGIGVVIILGINYLRPLFMSLEQLQYGIGNFTEAFVKYSSTGRYNLKTFSDYLFMLSDSFSSKYMSLEIAINTVNSGKHKMNFFYELIIAFVSLIPSKFLPFEKSASIVSYNTQYITGIFYSRIPPGGVAFGYYTMAIPGVILFSIFFGLLGRKLEKFFLNIDSKYSKVLYVIYMYLWVFTFLNGELRHTIQRDFILVVFLIILIKKVRPYIANDSSEIRRNNDEL